MTQSEKIKRLERALDRLVHACEDEVDDYHVISDACDVAKALLPDYKGLSEDERLVRLGRS